MDPSSVLDQTIQDVSNLPAEFYHILQEIKAIDMDLYELRKKTSMKDTQLQKFVRQNGSLPEYPKEEEINSKIGEELQQAEEMQKTKCAMANTALFLVTKHLDKLEKSIIVLEEDGLLAPLEEEVDSSGEYSRETSVMSTSERRKRKTTSSGSNGLGTKRRKQARTSPNRTQEQEQDQDSQLSKSKAHTSRQTYHQQSASREGSNSSSYQLTNRDNNFDLNDTNDDLFSSINANEEEDKTLYCFCQSVSFGEMVACDGENCKYEWFHYSCVNLKEPPKGAWYCPDCRQQMHKR